MMNEDEKKNEPKIMERGKRTTYEKGFPVETTYESTWDTFDDPYD